MIRPSVSVDFSSDSAGVMNTILMSVFERTRELGVMMAIGTTPRQVILLIFFETMFIEIGGILLGVAGGYLLVFYFQRVGIHFSGFEAAARSSFMSAVIYPKIQFYRVVDSIKTLVIISSITSLYPAWKASRMEPVKAIYQS